MVNARYVWKRLPTEHRGGTVLKAVHGVLAGLWKRDWGAVNRVLEEATIKHPLWAELRATVRAAQLALLARAHSSLSGASAAAALGVADAGPVLAAAGWSEQQGFFVPPPAEEAGEGRATVDKAQLSQLTNYLVFLERKA